MRVDRIGMKDKIPDDVLNALLIGMGVGLNSEAANQAIRVITDINFRISSRSFWMAMP